MQSMVGTARSALAADVLEHSSRAQGGYARCSAQLQFARSQFAQLQAKKRLHAATLDNIATWSEGGGAGLGNAGDLDDVGDFGASTGADSDAEPLWVREFFANEYVAGDGCHQRSVSLFLLWDALEYAERDDDGGADDIPSTEQQQAGQNPPAEFKGPGFNPEATVATENRNELPYQSGLGSADNNDMIGLDSDLDADFDAAATTNDILAKPSYAGFTKNSIQSAKTDAKKPRIQCRTLPNTKTII